MSGVPAGEEFAPLAFAISQTPTPRTAVVETGLVAGLAAYLIWGFLPLLFKLVSHVPSTTVVADRTLWSLVVVGAVLLIGRRLGEVRAALAAPATLRSMLFSATLLATNWLIFVYSVESGQLLEASFGYFITPLANVAVGLVLLGERLSRGQVVAIGIAVVGIGIQAIGLGGIPLIAIGLAVTFALYAYFRKTAKVSSTTGLFVETLLMAPVAAAYLGFTFVRDGGIGPHADPATLLYLMLLGPATVLALLLFAFGVQRIRMTTAGMLQYSAPSISFLIAVTLFGEPLNPVRLVSFALIWLSLIVYTADLMRRRRAAPLPAG